MRPLKRLEFLSAVTFSSGEPQVANLAPQYVLDICAPLIEVRHDTTLTFIHVSVKEFLQTASSNLIIDEKEAFQEHGVATVTCLLSGLEIFNKRYHEQTRCFRVVKGLHGFHIYATEYWTEYLLSQARGAGGLDTDSSLFDLACRLADKLNEAVGPTATTRKAETQSNVLDERVALLRQHPILYKHVKAALEARSLKWLESELLQEHVVPGGNSQSSSTSPALDGISAMLTQYQETIRSILGHNDHLGVSAEELELFKSQFRVSAFTCRLKSCPRATMGFESEKLRLEHEMTHMRRFRCTVPDCKFPPFASAQALKSHANKYHNPIPAPKSIRNIRVLPSAQRQRPGEEALQQYVREERTPPKQQARQKNQPTQLTPLSAANLDKNVQTLDKLDDPSSQAVVDPSLLLTNLGFHGIRQAQVPPSPEYLCPMMGCPFRFMNRIALQRHVYESHNSTSWYPVGTRRDRTVKGEQKPAYGAKDTSLSTPEQGKASEGPLGVRNKDTCTSEPLDPPLYDSVIEDVSRDINQTDQWDQAERECANTDIDLAQLASWNFAEDSLFDHDPNQGDPLITQPGVVPKERPERRLVATTFWGDYIDYINAGSGQFLSPQQAMQRCMTDPVEMDPDPTAMLNGDKFQHTTYTSFVSKETPETSASKSPSSVLDYTTGQRDPDATEILDIVIDEEGEKKVL
ncbi:hypothetical protein V8C37DRAFT_286169 [Trichoderma ceciliae]